MIVAYARFIARLFLAYLATAGVFVLAAFLAVTVYRFPAPMGGFALGAASSVLLMVVAPRLRRSIRSKLLGSFSLLRTILTGAGLTHVAH